MRKNLLLLLSCLVCSGAFATTFYWRPLSNPANSPAVTTQSWQALANWSTTTPAITNPAAIPGINDVCYFDALDGTNCSMDFNYHIPPNNSIANNISGINGIDMTGYTGTITQINGCSFSIGQNNSTPPTTFASGPVNFTGGSFVGSTNTADWLWIMNRSDLGYDAVFNNNFNAGSSDFRTLGQNTEILGGTFTIGVNGSWRAFPTVNLNATLLISPATFTADITSTTRILAPGTSGSGYNTTVSGNAITLGNLILSNNTIPTTITIDNAITAAGSACSISPNATTSFGLLGTGSLSFTNTAGTLTFGGTTTPISINSIAINVAGNFTNTNTATTGGGSGSINFNGTGAQTCTGGTGRLPCVYSTKASGALTFVNTNYLTGDWINNNSGTGSISFGTSTIDFAGTAAQTVAGFQTIGGTTCTFYNLTSNSTVPVTLGTSTNAVISNTLTMTAGNFNLNGRTLQLGNGAAATLSYTAGILYGGAFMRYFALGSAISGNGGLFPMGTTTDYRPVQLTSTVSPTGSGYVTANHTDAYSVTTVAYSDNLGNTIQARTDMKTNISTSNGFAGGTYNLDVSMTDLSPIGVTTDLKMGTIASPYGVGTAEVATGGTVAAPTVHRTGVVAAELANNDFVVATINSTNTPIRKFYYARKTGNWDDQTVGNGTWSYTSGGPSCDCVPIVQGFVYIQGAYTVTVVNPATIYSVLDISGGGILNGTAAFTVTEDLLISGNGTINPTSGAWSVARFLTLAGTGASSVASPATISVTGATSELSVLNTTSLTLGTNASLTGNLLVNGTLAIGGTTLTLNGSNTSLDGFGSVTGAGTLSVTTANKVILPTANLTVAPVFAITGAITVTNNGVMTLSSNLTGSAAGSTWNNVGTLNVGAAVLTTGTLQAHNGNNLVNYNGAGAQTIKLPSVTYHTLTASNSGTKSVTGSFSVTTLVTVSGTAVLDESTNILSGVCGLTMTGTSQLKLQRSTAATYPEFLGTYNLTGGTVILNQTAATPKMRGVTYYSLDFTGNQPYDMSLVSTINGDFTIDLTSYMINNAVLTVAGTMYYKSTNATATTLANNLTTGGASFTAASGGGLNCSSKTLKINGAAGWIKNTGFTFTAGTGIVSFEGASNQSIAGTATTETFNNLQVVKGGGTVSFGGSKTTLTVNSSFTETTGNFNASTLTTMAVTSAFTISANTFTAPSALNLNGNFTNGGLFTHNNGTVVFLGGLAQQITGPSTTEFYNLTQNNGSNLDLKLINNILTDNNLTLSSGKGNIDMNGSNINLGSTGQLVGEIASNRVYDNSGSMLGTISASGNISAGVGANLGNLGALLTDPTNSLGATTIIRGYAQQVDVTTGNLGINRYFDITPTLNTGLSTTLRFFYLTPEIPAGYVESSFDVFQSTDGGVTWADLTCCGPGTTTVNTVSHYVDLTGITDFSRWTLSDVSHPLPITWLDFGASLVNNTVQLSWSTASEINNNYFTVEKNTDGYTFQPIGNVKGAGNSTSVKNYGFVDYELPAFNDQLYYRIKQTDFNGKSDYSKIAIIDISRSPQMKLYPNPSSGSFSVILSTVKDKETLIVVRDVLGNEFYSMVLPVSNATEQVITINGDNWLVPGIYLVIASNDNSLVEKKIIIR